MLRHEYAGICNQNRLSTNQYDLKELAVVLHHLHLVHIIGEIVPHGDCS